MAIRPDQIVRSALFSDDRTYRYLLTRAWNDDAAAMVVVGLNPSRADEDTDDHTIRRLLSFADREGCGSLTVANLFALRSTDPAGLERVQDPVGPDNDTHLTRALTSGALVVAAWGDGGALHGRDATVIALIRKLRVQAWCLGRTVAGHPRHPLRLHHATPLKRFVGGPVNDQHPVTGIGYQGRDLPGFLTTIAELGAKTVVDIRESPRSRVRGFSRHVLTAALAEIGVDYRHEPALGNPRDNRPGFAADGPAQLAAHERFGRLLAGTEAQQALDRIAADAAASPVAVLCLEAEQRRCHRDLVLSALAARAAAQPDEAES